MQCFSKLRCITKNLFKTTEFLDAGILQKTKLLKLYQFPSSGESAGSM